VKEVGNETTGKTIVGAESAWGSSVPQEKKNRGTQFVKDIEGRGGGSSGHSYSVPRTLPINPDEEEAYNDKKAITWTASL